MRFLLFLSATAILGCSKPPSTAQPEPVQLNRKFFDDSGDPGKGRRVPQPK
jgi:hypothetical protein